MKPENLTNNTNDTQITLSPSSLLFNISFFFSSEGVSHEESWSFYPNAVRTAGFCGNPSFHLYWPNKNQDRTHNILATRELIVQPGYILQFKVQYRERNHKAALLKPGSFSPSLYISLIYADCSRL